MLFFVAQLLCITWVGTHAYLVDRVTVRLCEDSDRGIPEEERMPVFLNEIAFDGYVWNRHAEHMGQDGSLRLRHTDLDNAPHGREVHWNSAFAWYLRGLGEIYRAIRGDTLRNSIYRMSLWANPILLVVALVIFPVLAARRFGPLCGTVLAVGMVAVPTFYEGFMPAYPDHHGIISFVLLGAVFGIAWAGAGWVRQSEAPDFAAPATPQMARHGMIFSAICGAAGLWFSALSTAIVLGSIGLAALATAAAFGRDKPHGHVTASLDPGLWKVWAKWGSAMALALYAIEYFPNHMSMRMEINHPLYALAWLGGGWLVATLAGWLKAPAVSPFPWRKLVLPVAACMILPLVVLLGGDAVYSPRDPFMGRLWKNIAELLPLVTRIQLGGLTWQIALGWFPFLIVLAGILIAWKSTGRATKATLLFLCIPILLITGLQFYQTRWGLLAGPLYIALAAIVIPQAWQLTPRSLPVRACVGVAMLGFAFLLIKPAFQSAFAISWMQFQAGEKVPITNGQGLALLHRQMARVLKKDAGGRPVVLLSSPNSSCLLASMAGFQTIGTLYWENVEGLKAAARTLNAQTNEEALKLLKEHGVTHISLMTWENFIGPFFAILYPERVPGKSYESSFAKRALFDRVIPPWTRPLIFPGNDLTAGLQQSILMLAVELDQSQEDAKLNIAKFSWRVQDDPVAGEVTLGEILRDNPENLPARLELIDLLLSQRRYEAAAAELQKAASLPDFNATTLEDSINALETAGQIDAASALRNALTKPVSP
ncbi:MAG: hypothetical protein Fur0032_04680 [Terrimicrobiaceae bacterium]